MNNKKIKSLKITTGVGLDVLEIEEIQQLEKKLDTIIAQEFGFIRYMSTKAGDLCHFYYKVNDDE